MTFERFHFQAYDIGGFFKKTVEVTNFGNEFMKYQIKRVVVTQSASLSTGFSVMLGIPRFM